MKKKESLNEKTELIFNELLLNPNFIDDIKQLRKRHKIPINGFKNHEDYHKWDKKYKSTEIRTPITQETIAIGGLEDKPIPIRNKKPNYVITSYHLDLCNIFKKLDLSLEWIPYINDYIFFNKKQIKINPFEVRLERDIYNGIVLGENIHIEIGATTPSDYFVNKFQGHSRWSIYIEPLQKLMQGHKEKSKRPIKAKTKLQSRINRLFNEGKSDVDISSMPTLPEMKPQTIRQHNARFKKKITPNG